MLLIFYGGAPEGTSFNKTRGAVKKIVRSRFSIQTTITKPV